MVASIAWHDGMDSRAAVEVRIAPSATLLSAVRVVAADLAARQDFDLDAVADLRVAVDEACATLVPLAAPGTMLSCQFTIHTGHTGSNPDNVADAIEVLAMVTAKHPTQVPQNTLGWRMLSTLTDEVHAVSHGGDGDELPSVGIRLCLRHKRADG